jgi:hypothetical protein
MTITPPSSAAPSDRKIAERIWEDWKRPSSSHDNDIVDMIERALSTARREARAAAIEECTTMCDRFAQRVFYTLQAVAAEGRDNDMYWANTAWHNVTGLAEQMRALLAAPEPTQEK